MVHLEETFPFRSYEIIDEMIIRLLQDGYDTVIAAYREAGSMWYEDSNKNFRRIDKGDIPREFKEKTLLGLHGLGCVTHSEFIRNENMTGFRTGLFKVDHPLASFEVRDSSSAKFGELLIDAMEEIKA